jgi:SAM-dependent methyltransferase
MSAFKDHFSTRSADYAAYRPTYPAALVNALADLCPATGHALDVGCGSGQLSVLLAERFAVVTATDASAEQIAKAAAHPRVAYAVAPAERTGLPAGSVDLVTAAQAAHWFDLDAFYAEARRVARPAAALALVTYGVMRLEGPAEEVVRHYYWNVIGPYWPPERRHVEDGYRSLPFPFAAIELPPLAIEVAWQRSDFLGYVETWSAVRALETSVGRGPVKAFARDLEAVWPDPEERRIVRFPLSVRAGRIAD